jgi:hypothetical protein
MTPRVTAAKIARALIAAKRAGFPAARILPDGTVLVESTVPALPSQDLPVEGENTCDAVFLGSD